MNVIKSARSVGLDLLILPSYSFHTMQPLNVACLKPFKQAFFLLQDVWMGPVTIGVIKRNVPPQKSGHTSTLEPYHCDYE
jgi:hypothetical protein